jgi:hypothetical protein
VSAKSEWLRAVREFSGELCDALSADWLITSNPKMKFVEPHVQRGK